MNTRIQQIRKTAKMTQDEFAEKIGVSKNFVWMIEKADHDQLYTIFRFIISFLGLK